jgi:adenosylcobinamide-GDP ribazoletransferase
MSGFRRAVALFTVVPGGRPGGLDRASASAAMRWLPLIGALLGAVAGLPAVAVLHWRAPAHLLGAAAAVVLLVLLTRALHLDGLADTVDGLGSRAPAERALEIMRRSDIGPFGVTAIVLVLTVDVAALDSYAGGCQWWPLAALAVAAATGRLAALLAAHVSVPSARPDGFGAHAAGTQTSSVLAAESVAVLGFGAAMAAWVHAGIAAWVIGQAAAVLATVGFLLHVRRRIGGVTGDVFGAMIEVATALTLAGLALS